MPRYYFDVYVECRSLERHSVCIQADSIEEAEKKINGDDFFSDGSGITWGDLLDDEVEAREYLQHELKGQE